MKSLSKFSFGLSCGLLISFLFFNVETANSSHNNALVVPSGMQGSVPQDNPKKGEWITPQQAAPLIQAYKTKVLNVRNLSEGSTGGIIGKKYLRNIDGGITDNGNVKYHFYYT